MSGRQTSLCTTGGANTHLPIVSAKPTKINAMPSSPRSDGGSCLNKIAKIGSVRNAWGTVAR